MTATTAPTRTTIGTDLSAAGIIRSEWIKLRSVRSTTWPFAILIVGSVAIAMLTALSFRGDGASNAEQQTAVALNAATFSISFGQLVMAVVGVLAIGGEYSTGMIRSTLTAVPHRVPALLAKAVVLFAASFGAGAITMLASYVATLPLLASRGITADLSDGTFVRDLLLAALYLAGTSVFALGIGTIMRSSTGATTVTLGIILVLPVIAITLYDVRWVAQAAPYLFSNAGAAMYGAGGALDPGPAGLVLAAWTAVSLGLGAVLLARRDA
jgi:ABC-2 type transport system permease protein